MPGNRSLGHTGRATGGGPRDRKEMQTPRNSSELSKLECLNSLFLRYFKEKATLSIDFDDVTKMRRVRDTLDNTLQEVVSMSSLIDEFDSDIERRDRVRSLERLHVRMLSCVEEKIREVEQNSPQSVNSLSKFNLESKLKLINSLISRYCQEKAIVEDLIMNSNNTVDLRIARDTFDDTLVELTSVLTSIEEIEPQNKVCDKVRLLEYDHVAILSRVTEKVRSIERNDNRSKSRRHEPRHRNSRITDRPRTEVAEVVELESKMKFIDLEMKQKAELEKTQLMRKIDAATAKVAFWEKQNQKATSAETRKHPDVVSLNSNLTVSATLTVSADITNGTFPNYCAESNSSTSKVCTPKVIGEAIVSDRALKQCCTSDESAKYVNAITSDTARSNVLTKDRDNEKDIVHNMATAKPCTSNVGTCESIGEAIVSDRALKQSGTSDESAKYIDAITSDTACSTISIEDACNANTIVRDMATAKSFTSNVWTCENIGEAIASDEANKVKCTSDESENNVDAITSDTACSTVLIDSTSNANVIDSDMPSLNVAGIPMTDSKNGDMQITGMSSPTKVDETDTSVDMSPDHKESRVKLEIKQVVCGVDVVVHHRSAPTEQTDLTLHFLLFSWWPDEWPEPGACEVDAVIHLLTGPSEIMDHLLFPWWPDKIVASSECI